MSPDCKRDRKKRDPQEVALEAATLLMEQPTPALIAAIVSLAESVVLLADRELAQQKPEFREDENENPHRTELRQELESASKAG